MKKFETKISQNRWGAQVFKIIDDNHNYLHSDGVVYPCGEYWPTQEQAQAVLDKYRYIEKSVRLVRSYSMGVASFLAKITPKHVWVEGDIGVNSFGDVVEFTYCTSSRLPQILFLTGDDRGSYKGWDDSIDPGEATFLFNIKDKLKEIEL